MKKLLSLFVMALAFCVSAVGQVNPSTSIEYNWGPATATGVVGSYLILDAATPPGQSGPPAPYNIQVYVTGTVPTTCTFEVQSSPDGVAWDTGADTPSGDINCGSATVKTYFFANEPIRRLRINIGTLTGADGTTQVHFFYTRGRNAQ